MGGVVEIPLSGKYGEGKVALVDADKLNLVRGWRWKAIRANGGTYACAYGGRGKIIYMHRVLKSRYGMITDHINGNTLDNRVENLRVCSKVQSQRNRQKDRTVGGRKTTSKYKGVYLSSNPALKRPWVAHINHVHLGCFLTEKEAAVAYDVAARGTFGEYARYNFPEPGERSAIRVAD